MKHVSKRLLQITGGENGGRTNRKSPRGDNDQEQQNARRIFLDEAAHHVESAADLGMQFLDLRAADFGAGPRWARS